MKKEKKIPTILGIILLAASIIAGLYLTTRPLHFGSKAGGDCQPDNVRISNITHQSFTISFSTAASCLSVVSLENRTVSDQNNQSRLHYFQIDGLQPDSGYGFTIISGGQNYSSDTYRTRTAKKPKSPLPTSNLAWGRVFDSGRNPAIGSIVFLSFGQGVPLSARVTTKGYWSISLVNSFNPALDDWALPPQDTSEEIIVFGPDGSVTTLEGNTSRNNPVPDIILGLNEFQDPVSPDPMGNLDPGSAPPTAAYSLTITNPSEGETVTVPQPEFFGTAPSGVDVIIKVESTSDMSGRVAASGDGSWSWSPPQNLIPGQQTLTVSAANPQTGLTDTITRQFTVFAQNVGGPGFVASASASVLTPTRIPSPTPRLTAKLSPAPTSIPTLMPTVTPRAARPTVSSGQLVRSGTSGPTLLLLVMSTAMIVLGYFYIKKNTN